MMIHCDTTAAKYKQPSRYHSYVRHLMRERGELPPLELYSPEDALKAAGLI